MSGSARCAHFAYGVHEAAVSDGGQQEGESKIEAEDAGAQGAVGEGYGVAGAKGDVFVDATIFAERDFAFGAAIEIVEHGARDAAAGERTKVGDVDDAGRCDGAGVSGHSSMQGRAIRLGRSMVSPMKMRDEWLFGFWRM